MRTRLFTLLLAVCLPTVALARDIFVDNSLGEDGNSGETPTSQGAGIGPVRCLTRALIRTQKGDRVILANTGVPYRECATLQAAWHSGYDRITTFRLIGNGAVLDGTSPVPAEGWEFVRGTVFRIRPPKMAYQTLFADDQPLVRKYVTAATMPELKPLEWCLFDTYIYFCSEQDRLPQEYPLRYGGMQTGLTLYDVHHVEISDLHLRGFQLDGVNVHDNCCGIKLINVVSEHNGRSGFSISGWCKTVLDECSAGGNGAAQVRVDEMATVTLIGGNYQKNGVPDVLRIGGRLIRQDPPKP